MRSLPVAPSSGRPHWQRAMAGRLHLDRPRRRVTNPAAAGSFPGAPMDQMKLGLTIDLPQALIDALNRIATAVEANTAVLGHLIEYRAAPPRPDAEPLPPAGDGASPVPETHVAPSAPAGGSGQPGAKRRKSPVYWRTPERAAYLRAWWPHGLPIAEIRAALQSMEGPPVPSDKDIGVAAYALGLRRPDGHIGTRTRPHAAPPVAAVAAPPRIEAPPILEPVALPLAAAPAPAPIAVPSSPPLTRPSIAPRVAVPLSTQVLDATFATIRQKAGAWGLPFDRPDDLPAVNAKARRLGLPTFNLVKG